MQGVAFSDVNAEAKRNAKRGKTRRENSKHIVNVSDKRNAKSLRDVLAAHGRVTHWSITPAAGFWGLSTISLKDFDWLGAQFWASSTAEVFFLPILKEQEKAHIVNISSVFGLVAPPEQTAYASSKFAVRGFTEALRHELEDTNVRVSSVHPGGIKTNIARNSRLGAETPEEYKQQGAKFFDKVAQTTPEQAAETILRGIKSENPRILIGKDAHAINYISRLFPKRYLKVVEKIAGHRLDLRKKA